MTHRADLSKRLRQAELRLTPKRAALHNRSVVTDKAGTWQVTSAPGGSGGCLVLPVILSLDAWEAQASASQDKLVMEARDELVDAGDYEPADTSLQYRKTRH